MSSITSSICVTKGDNYSFGLRLSLADITGYTCNVTLRDKSDYNVVIDSKLAPISDGIFLVELWPDVSGSLIVGHQYILAGTVVNSSAKFAKTSSRQIEITQD